MSDLVAEIRTAREAVTKLEAETSESGHRLRLSKEKLRKARGELDVLLQELCTGQSRYTLPGFDQVVPAGNGDGQIPPTVADQTPVRPSLDPPLRGRRRKEKTS
jgi:hypothetical protein